MFRLFHITALLVFYASTSVVAQAEEPDVSVLPPVVVEDVREESPLDYPSAFSTVIRTRDFAGEFNTASELLSFSPGVVVRDFGGFGQLKTISIRGSSNQQVVILLDGIRISGPFGGGVDLSTIPIEYVDRFEVIRGGASALAGSDAIGGVVNIVTKKGGEEITNLSLTAGSFKTINLNLSRSGVWRGLDYFFSYSHAHSRGDFEYKSINGLKVERINNEFFSESFLAKIETEVWHGWRVTFLNEFFFDDKGVPGLGEFQEDSSNQRDLRFLAALKLEKQSLFVSSLDYSATLYNRFDQLEFEDPEPTLGLPVDTLSRTNMTGLEQRLTWYAPLNQVVTLGADVRFETLRDESFDNPNRFTFSAFAGDEISLFDGRILINPIVRLDLFKTSGEVTSTDAEISPKLGVIFTPWKNISIKGNIGRSFRAPTFSELFFPEQGFIGGNPDLESENSIDFDAGIVVSHPRFVFEATYFKNRIDDLILFVFISAQRIEPRNVGKVDEQGIETSLLVRPIPHVELFASYTFLEGELEDTGAQLPGRPKNRFDFRGVLDLNYLKLYWESHFTDAIPLTVFPNSRQTESRTVHDIGAQVNWKNAFLTVELKNLTDNLDVRDAFDFPLPGRQLYFTAGVKF